MEISQEAWAIVEKEILSTGHGTVTLIVQDGRLIQLDKTEKIRLVADPNDKAKPTTYKQDESLRSNLRARLLKILDNLRYGQIVIVIKSGKITQVEKLEKHRVGDLQGLFGEGI